MAMPILRLEGIKFDFVIIPIILKHKNVFSFYTKTKNSCLSMTMPIQTREKYLIWFRNKIDRFETTNPFVFDEDKVF
jgi:hypothetical protein